MTASASKSKRRSQAFLNTCHVAQDVSCPQPVISVCLLTTHTGSQAAIRQEVSGLEDVQERVTQQLLDVQEQLTSERATLTSRNNSLQSDVDKLTAQHMLTLNKLEAMSVQLQDTVLQHQDLKIAHTDLHSSHTALQDKSAATATELQTLQGIHADVTQAAAHLQAEVAQLSAELKSEQAHTQELKVSLSESEATSVELRAALASAQTDSRDLRLALADSGAAHSELSNRLAVLQAEAESSITAVRGDLQVVTAQHAEAERLAEQLSMELSELNRQHHAVSCDRQVRFTR